MSRKDTKLFSVLPSHSYTQWVLYSSVAQSCPTLQSHGLQHIRPPCPSQTPRACSNPCPSSQWCHPTIHLFILFMGFSRQEYWSGLPFPSLSFVTLHLFEGNFKWCFMSLNYVFKNWPKFFSTVPLRASLCTLAILKGRELYFLCPVQLPMKLPFLYMEHISRNSVSEHWNNSPGANSSYFLYSCVWHHFLGDPEIKF